MNYLIYVDGLCKHNGFACAEAAGSFAVYVSKIKLEVNNKLHEILAHKKPIFHASRFTVVSKGRNTNNIAEAQSLHTALVWAFTNGLFKEGNEVHLCMDSKLVLNQFIGLYRTKNKFLQAIYQQIYELFKENSKKFGINTEQMLKIHWISGDIMKASVIGH